MIYRISIKMYRYTYSIDQSDRYAALIKVSCHFDTLDRYRVVPVPGTYRVPVCSPIWLKYGFTGQPVPYFNPSWAKQPFKLIGILAKLRLISFNTLRPSNAIWWHKSVSTLAQVMVWYLTAPSHYLNQCWLIISEVQWHSPEVNLTRDTSAINH